ncbi:MAG: ubiquinone biosynthesis regulatory protein kinase UbiB [Gammaproteobacteria bacterium]|nr:ubiquinone biosynthesis regulatory protein kinase UbiB [Gammaproteobacteria bacterium]
MRLKQWLRLFKIAFICQKFGLDDIVFQLPWFHSFRFVLWLNPIYWFYRRRNQSDGERLRLAFEILGPIFVKLGQILSTRPDLIPEEMARALSKLQDQVKPFPSAVAVEILRATYGIAPDQIFAEFNPEPLASASIAQVHTARLTTGEEVVVKILRPNVTEILRDDISLLYGMASIIDRFWAGGQRLKLHEVVAELERNILDELDLMREAANGSQLRRNFSQSTMLYVPEIYWDYCRHNVLVMERIYGVPATDLDALRHHSVNLKLLAERGVEIFYTQVFRDCFFHADMHPGNIFISLKNPDDPQFIAIDFGIMGTLSKEDQHYLAANFLAFFKRDYRRVAELHIASGWVPPNTRVDVLESAIRTVCEPIFEKPLKDISFGQTLLRLFQIARRFDMEVQPQLLLLQKTLLNIEGMGRELYPELDLWATARPFLEKWMREQIGLKGLWRRLKSQLPLISERLPEVPELLYELLKHHHQKAVLSKHTILNDSAMSISPQKKQRNWSYASMGLGAGILAFTGSNSVNTMHFSLAPEAHLLAFSIIGLMLVGIGFYKKS